jgi:hypothetical protein
MPQATPQATPQAFDQVGFIIAYEGGELDEEQVIEGFQHLIDNGLAWSLQGCYGRMAKQLIEAGHCTDTHNVLGG